MKKELNYKAVFDKYFNIIKSSRDPKSERPEMADFEWNTTIQQAMFSYSGSEFAKYNENVETARILSIKCIEEIISILQRSEDIFDYLDSEQLKAKFKNICFSLKDKSKNEIYIFKEIEKCRMWKMRGKEPQIIQEFIESNGANSCKYIYFMYDFAYKQVFGYDDNEENPSRNTNCFSFKWFFSTYFGEEEYECFNNELQQYIQKVNDYLGYFLVKALTPNAMYHFKMITEHQIRHFPYDRLYAINAHEYMLPDKGLLPIENQFFEMKTYLITMGASDFSESIITAEWLRDSMKKAKAIDLTIVAMGYFKAVEQLLYNLICLHANEGRMIKKDYSRKDIPDSEIEVCDKYIEEKAMDTTIGSMANFFKDNLELFNSELPFKTRKYIRESIFAYKDLRNGYLHKDNIHDWSIIEEVRNASFNLIFLLLGAFKFSEDDIKKLGVDRSEEYNDYEKLCEYVNFHASDIFIIELGYGEQYAAGCRDLYSSLIDNRKMKYSGVYLKELGQGGRTFRFTETSLPKEVYLGKFSFAETEMIDAKPVKVAKIFENGKYIGPLLVDEQRMEY